MLIKKSCFFVVFLGLSFLGNLAFCDNQISYIPHSGIEKLFSEKLDIASFRSSLGPRRRIDTRTFKSLGIPLKRINKKFFRHENDDWIYQFEVKGRKDYNRDGIEDLALCFVDKSKKGTYSTVSSLLVTRYSGEGYLVAIDYEIDICGD